jgi:type IV secretory pathway VirB2 component (pilin)
MARHQSYILTFPYRFSHTAYRSISSPYRQCDVGLTCADALASTPPVDDTEPNPLFPPFLMIKTIQNLPYSLATAGMLAMAVTKSAFAQGDNDFAGPQPEIGGIPDVTDPEDVRTIITDILQAVLNFLGLIAVIVIIIAGIRLIVSQGEDEQKDKAKKTILYAIVGLVVVLFAKVIVSLVTVYLAGELENSGGVS